MGGYVFPGAVATIVVLLNSLYSSWYYDRVEKGNDESSYNVEI